MTHRQFIYKVIKVRRKLIHMQCSKVDALQCKRTINRLDKLMKAYGQKWNTEGWRQFLTRNYNEVLLLIPKNGSQKYIEDLNKLIEVK